MNKLILAREGRACLPIRWQTAEEDAGMGTADAAAMNPEAIQSMNGDQSAPEERAARALAHGLARVTGADFPVEPMAEGDAITLAVDPALPEEGFSVTVTESAMAIRGGSPRGLFYGVFAFLEEKLGVGYYTHDITRVPFVPDLALEPMTWRDAPAMEYRQVDGPLQSSPAWRAHNRLNAFRDSEGTPRNDLGRYGGGKGYALFVHTFSTLVPPEAYFAAHPEYYSLREGERTPDQLCLTNPEVLAITIESVKKVLRAHPGMQLISVSQNDALGATACTCPECARIDREEGSPSGTLLRFVNAVAEAIEPEFPDVTVDTLAYRYTRRPPRITRPRHNVCVRLCTIECCFGHPIGQCDHVPFPFAMWQQPDDPTFREDLEGWSRICDRIYIWDYVTNFIHYPLPFPNFHVLGPNMRYYAAHGVKGVYAEGDYHAPNPDLNELRQWLLAKLMWNPDFDVEQGILDFTEAVYGPAAPEIRAYIRLLERRVTEGNIHFGIYEPATVAYLDGETLAEARTLLAAACAKDLPLAQRLYTEKVALSLEFAAVAQEVAAGRHDRARIDALIDRAATLGIDRFSEMIDGETSREQLLGEGKYFRDFYQAR